MRFFLSIRNDLYFGFHRLRINGLDLKSNQPFHLKGCYLICNGEIYNFEKLRKSYPEYYSSSDCEIIIHLYRRHGIERTLQMLDGVFAFMLFDEVKNVVYAARDPIGIRPLFLGNTENGIAIAPYRLGKSTYPNPRYLYVKQDDTYPTQVGWNIIDAELQTGSLNDLNNPFSCIVIFIFFTSR